MCGGQLASRTAGRLDGLNFGTLLAVNSGYALEVLSNILLVNFYIFFKLYFDLLRIKTIRLDKEKLYIPVLHYHINPHYIVSYRNIPSKYSTITFPTNQCSHNTPPQTCLPSSQKAPRN